MAGNDGELSALGQEVANQVLPQADVAAQRFPVTTNNHPTSEEDFQRAMTDLRFGEVFGDYMATMDWVEGEGWTDRKVEPFGPLDLSPAAAVLHYSQEIFEGLKAFRWEDGSIWTFRPGFNAARFNHSARRMAMPEVALDDFIGSLVQVVRCDERWVPTEDMASLYLRPFMVASEPFLGIRVAKEHLYAVISSPVGSFFKDGLNPVSIYVTTDFHRAAPGGTGAAKTGGNYASSLLPQLLAHEKGYEQVCYLDAKTATNLEELGGMNMFVVRKDGTVQTPKLTGTILEGGTRSAVIQLLQDQNTPVEEVTLPLAQVVADIESGDITELFACGTAALVTPIGRLGGEGFDLTIPGTQVSAELYEQLAGIQRGTAPDPHGWMYQLA